MDFSRALGAEFRQVRDAERDGQPVRAVEGSRWYRTRIEDLWQAITDPERLPRWFLPVHGDLRPGGRYQLEGNAGGTIERCDPPRALDLTWEFGDNTSWLRVRLAAEDEGSRLTLVHSMAKDEASEKHWAEYGPGATGVGWDLALLGLGLYLEGDGDAIDRQESDAWLASEDGKAFVRESAESWGRVHAVGGEEPEVAQAMAARTARFYTGES